MECESKIYARHCDCVMDYMPRANDNVTICGLSDGECIADVDHQIHLKVNKSFVCECLPGFEHSVLCLYYSATCYVFTISDAST